jgi:hypothetical protein
VGRTTFATATTTQKKELVDGDVWDATDEFGSALHPAMDIYAHSNWVEMGFPLTPDTPSTASVDVARSNLLDIRLGNDDLTIRVAGPSTPTVVGSTSPL